jgi:hypothetical protein
MFDKHIVRRLSSVLLALAMLLTLSGVAATDKPDPMEKISPMLMDRFKQDGFDSTQSVAVWINDINHEEVERLCLEKVGVNRAFIDKHPDIGHKEVDAYIKMQRSLAVERYGKNNNPFAEKYLSGTKITFISRYAPMILASLTYEQAKELCYVPDVRLIEWVNDKAESEILGTVVQELNKVDYNATTPTPSASQFNGSGVRIGLLEMGIPHEINTNPRMVLVPVTGIMHPGADSDRDHASRVGKIIEVMVPNATIYCAMVTTFPYVCRGIENLLDHGVNIINSSRGLITSNNSYNETARWLDHIALNHSVHFVQGSGNWGKDTKLHETFSLNAIVVGAVNEANNGRWIEASRESSYLPSNIYSLANNIVAKPDLSAPGEKFNFSAYGSSAWWNIDPNSNRGSGTSFSTPIVTGALAKLCHQRAALKTQQSAAKALLAAAINSPTHGLRNMSGTVEFERLGAGLINANQAIHHSHLGRHTSGTLAAGTNNQVQFPFTVGNETRVRVALAYLKHNQFNPGVSHVGNMPNEQPLADLFLEVHKGGVLVARSHTQGNLEVLQFSPQSNPNWGSGTYTITIRRNGTNSFANQYGAAWYLQ